MLKDYQFGWNGISYCRHVTTLRPFDGAIQNNFVLDKLIVKAKRNKSKLHILLLDLKNAFGCISRSAILRAFEKSGVGKLYSEILTDIYLDTITQLLTTNGLSKEILINLGVKQGFPLSGPVFNLVINPIFEAIQIGRAQLHGLGYADDTAAIEKLLKDFQDTLNRIVDCADK